MSNRRGRARAAGRSYTARLQRRAAYRPPRRWPTRLTGRHVTALLALAAEAGHLAAAMIEWPAATPRGAFHVLAAGVLGVVTVGVYFGPSRAHLTLGLAVTLLVPGLWLAGTIAGASPYRHYPLPGAAALTLAELILAALMGARWRATPPQPTNRTGGRAGPREPPSAPQVAGMSAQGTAHG